jgi:leucyl-tRNA---protein transferase
VDTIEFAYRDAAGKLLGVGLCDVCDESLSTVYFYHDPAESRRGIGTYSALYEIEHARRLGIPYYYLGFWIAACGKMNYKATFRPSEVLHPDGVWRPNPAPASPDLP